ncbi:HAD family hydrolase [Rhizobium sp. TRM95111]|uniref:HAD-IIB family hydrolase n=1 Tax=Rhizobium alarense TaxID=2846851 RepID=UPI001F3E7815|nr:HAD-IIB family hydrolase [Rhizobium alarense]MCF3643298.1 HAD family hydrolase [Rhizobium alarense]
MRMLSSDIDGTLTGDRRATQRFRTFWEALNPLTRPLLVYNSGRLIDDIEALIEVTDLPVPDYMIGGVGTMIGGLAEEKRRAYGEVLGKPFDRDALMRVMQRIDGIRLQADEYQHQHKSSWHLHGAGDETIADIETRLAEAGLDAKLVYSSGRDLDVLPRAADKGAALVWLCRDLGIDPGEVVVAGDTGNDRDMFLLPDVRGIAVANALPELQRIVAGEPRHFQATRPHADGVVEGLRHWGLAA